MRKFFLIAILVIITGVLYAVLDNFRTIPPVPPTGMRAERVAIRIHGQNILAEIANTEEEKEKGLGGRTALGSNEGMFFPFPERGSYGFWMKGMKIPIDIVWISGTTVIGFEENVPFPQDASVDDGKLPVYLPPSPVDGVLELQAGKVKSIGLQAGDLADFERGNGR